MLTLQAVEVSSRGMEKTAFLCLLERLPRMGIGEMVFLLGVWLAGCIWTIEALTVCRGHGRVPLDAGALHAPPRACAECSCRLPRSPCDHVWWLGSFSCDLALPCPALLRNCGEVWPQSCDWVTFVEGAQWATPQGPLVGSRFPGGECLSPFQG